MTISQEGRRTQITTVLDTDEFAGNQGKLVAGMVQCSESFSLPYTIDLQMYAERSLDIAPATLINTPATVRVRVEDETESSPFTYQERKGIFQTFSRQPRVHFREPFHKDLNFYIGRLVPAFFIMAQEVRYRVFENLSVIDIIRACMGRFQGIDLGTYVSEGSFASLANDDVSTVKLEHAIQYGESTFNFLSRLMNRASIWYTFDHDNGTTAKFETMLIGKGPKTGFPSCTEFRNFVDPRDLPNLEQRKRWRILTGVTRTFTPTGKIFRVGEFNTILPSSPLESTDGGTTVVAPEANVINGTLGKERPQPDVSQNEPKTGFILESFPDLGAFGDEDTTQDAQTALEIGEAQVEVLSGMSGNASFMAGRVFALTEGAEEHLPERNYLITQLSFAAYDRNYLYIVKPNAADGLGQLINDLVIQPFTSVLDTVDNIPPPDVTTVLAAQGLANYLQDWYDYAEGLDFSVSKYGGSNRTAAVVNYSGQILGNVVTAVAAFAGGGVLPLVYTVLQDLAILVEKIIDGVLKAIALALDVIASVVLAIPALIQKIFHKETTLGKVLDAIRDAETWLENKIHPFFRPKYVDGYSASFNAVAVARKGQRQGAGIPLPAAQKTVINGPHLATVIGPGGLYAKKDVLYGIYADKLGRVRIRFPWDRSPLGLDKSAARDGADKAQYLYGGQTVWVRVSDAWAGGYDFGSQFLPRVGDEVVVSFVDGDPDRPVITGRLYNPGRKGQSNLPFPVPGPIKAKQNKDAKDAKGDDAITSMKDLTNIASTENQFTRSGIKTRSTPPTGPDTPSGFNMLRFDDKAGHEQLLLRSQNRLDITALGSRYETIGGDRNLTIGWIDTKHSAVGGNYIAKVYQDYHLHIGDAGGPFNGGHRFERVEKDYHLQVKADTNFNLDGDWNVSVGGKASITADSIVLKATKSVTVIVGNSIIVVQADGIYNEAAIHYEQSGGDGQAANDAVLKLPKDPTNADSGKDPQSNSGSS
jgi:uncharacterized protein involved in type VI secretion and phage assembly